jgi:glycine cleavage system H lipoate-binding protein
MFPGVYGFEWNAGYLIFLGVFFAVVLVVFATVALALWRAWRDARERRVEAIRWHSDFHDLAERDRRCRHEIAGRVAARACDNGFDCRSCATHAKLAAPAGAGRLHHRGHTWVETQPDGTVTVGLDEMASRLVGKPDEVELPPAGSRVEVNGTGWKMRRLGAEVRVLSPVEGEVVAAGGPDAGWFLKVRPSSFNMAHLLEGEEASRWLVREMERVQLMLGAEAGPALADGGVMVEDVPAAQPRADWDAVWGRVFLAP